MDNEDKLCDSGIHLEPIKTDMVSELFCHIAKHHDRKN